MKSAKDPRHIKRIQTVKELFSNLFHDQEAGEETKKVLAKVTEIDKLIEEAAPAWPIKKLNKIDLAILRLATYELTHTDTPEKVIIDEAVEIAKEFGGESSPSFVNGVLGFILKKKNE